VVESALDFVVSAVGSDVLYAPSIYISGRWQHRVSKNYLMAHDFGISPEYDANANGYSRPEADAGAASTYFRGLVFA
jgi:hypothetical protein